jgi:hypothetical protein
MFSHGIPEEERFKLKAALEVRPPKVIILDGYSQRIYLRDLPWLRELLQSRYQSVGEAGPGVYPVKVYQLKEGLPIEQLRDQASSRGQISRSDTVGTFLLQWERA